MLNDYLQGTRHTGHPTAMNGRLVEITLKELSPKKLLSTTIMMLRRNTEFKSMNSPIIKAFTHLLPTRKM